jgi:hypothetical protein
MQYITNITFNLYVSLPPSFSLSHFLSGHEIKLNAMIIRAVVGRLVNGSLLVDHRTAKIERIGEFR